MTNNAETSASTAIKHQGDEAVVATRSGRWGVRQIDRHGDNTGGGTVGVGWATSEEAEQANPPMAGYTFEPFERWSDDHIRLHDCGRFHRSSEPCPGGGPRRG